MNKFLLKLSLLSVVMVFSCLTLFAQTDRTITGTVKDESGRTMPGVSVQVKGTTKATSTNNDGKFSISANNSSVLVFKYLGYKLNEVTVGSNASLDVSLEPSSLALSEVMITGFGVKKEARKLSYSATEVKGEDLTRANNANIVNALQGKVAGVMINQGASGPQSSSRIRIRGNSSLGGNTQPLVVIDGVLFRPGITGADSWGDAADFGNVMKNLNSDDYESVTVLKGSAASALYGSDAQNGVLLITTKKGRAGKGLGVNVSQTSSFDKAYKLVDFQNSYGAGISPTFTKDANGVDVVDNVDGPFYSFGPKLDGHMVKDIDGKMRPWKANNPLDFFNTGKFINTNVSVEGGSDNTTFRLSYTNLDNSSVLPGNSLKRDAFALRATQNISKSISIDASVNYTMSNSFNPGRQGSAQNSLFQFTYYMPRSADIDYFTHNYIDPIRGGRLGVTNSLDDPYHLTSFAYTFFGDNRTQKESNLIANIDLNLKLTPWLSGLIKANTNAYNTVYERKNRGAGVGFSGGDYQINQTQSKTYRLQGLLNATKNITEDLELNASLGWETNRNNLNNAGYTNSTSTNGGLKIPQLYYIANSINPATTSASPLPGYRSDAVYLYGDITWKNMLTLNFSGRNDWSSTLVDKDGNGNPSFFYPSVGLAWVFTELPSFKDKSSVLSYGKLRAAYSYTGLGVTPQSVNRTGYYNLNGTFNNSTGGNQQYYGFVNNVLRNDKVKSQLTKEFELGADLRFLKERLGLDISYYKRNSTNQLLSFALPSESGVSSQDLNAGNIQNQGVEILFTAKPVVSKDFNWTSVINFTRNKNKIISLVEGVDTYGLDLAFGADVSSVAKVGSEYGSIMTGSAFAYYQKKDANGKPIASASNGKKVLGNTGYGTTGGYYTYVRSQDYDGTTKNLGTMMEKFLASTTQQFSYKDFSLGFQVDAKVGGLMASGTHQYGSANGSLANSLFGRDEASGGITYTDANGAVHHDGIIPDGVLNDGITAINGAGVTVDLGGMTYADAVKQGLLKPIPAYAYYENLSQWSSGIREYSIFENTWVAVREVSVGYNIPSKYLRSLKINNLRINLVGRNLGYLYKTAKDGINPEGVLSNRPGAFNEYGGSPYVRSLGFNIKAGF